MLIGRYAMMIQQTRNLAREQYQKRALIEKIKDELEKGRPT